MKHSLYPPITDRGIHDAIESYMLSLIIDIGAIYQGRNPIKPIDGYRLAILPRYIEDLQNCSERHWQPDLHEIPIQSLIWFIDTLTKKDWSVTIGYAEFKTHWNFESDLGHCRTQLKHY